MSEKKYLLTHDEICQLQDIALSALSWEDREDFAMVESRQDEYCSMLEAHEYEERTCHCIQAKRPNGAEGLGVFGICDECGGKLETTDAGSKSWERPDAFCRTCGAKVVER